MKKFRLAFLRRNPNARKRTVKDGMMATVMLNKWPRLARTIKASRYAKKRTKTRMKRSNAVWNFSTFPLSGSRRGMKTKRRKTKRKKTKSINRNLIKIK